MQLIELRANKETFHTITFQQSRCVVIRAIKVSEDKKVPIIALANRYLYT